MVRSYVNKLMILRFINDYYQKNHYSPSLREICQGTGLRSTSTVHRYLCELSKEGKLVYMRGKRRALALEEDSAKEAEVTLSVADGSDPNWIKRLPEGDKFTVNMNDSGMIDALIEAGDKLTVVRQDNPEVGSIVVAIHDDYLLIRRLGIVNDNFYLVPDNDVYIPVRKKDAAIVGKVISMQRDL